MGGRVPDEWNADDDQSKADALRERWGLDKYVPDDEQEEDDDLREKLDMGEPDPVPTHECGVCLDFKAHIESSPGKDYRWCPECEGVQRFVRLDRADS